MLNSAIQQKILGVLQGHVFSTSMVARKTKLSRITVSKYLNAMQGKNIVQAVRIGKAVAWRCFESKPTIAILAKPGTARIVKLSLGDKYTYVLAVNPASVRDAFVAITDNVQYAKSLHVPVILIGGHDDNVHSLPELFDTATLKVLVKKVLHEQSAPLVHANAQIVIEHLEECEDVIGVHKADELIKLTLRLLRESRLPVRQYERTTFLVEGEVPEGILLDIEQTFHLILAHVYGRMVHPGEQITYDSIVHTVPSLTIAFSTQFEEDLEE